MINLKELRFYQGNEVAYIAVCIDGMYDQVNFVLSYIDNAIIEINEENLELAEDFASSRGLN